MMDRIGLVQVEVPLEISEDMRQPLPWASPGSEELGNCQETFFQDAMEVRGEVRLGLDPWNSIQAFAFMQGLFVNQDSSSSFRNRWLYKVEKVASKKRDHLLQRPSGKTVSGPSAKLEISKES